MAYKTHNQLTPIIIHRQILKEIEPKVQTIFSLPKKEV